MCFAVQQDLTDFWMVVVYKEPQVVTLVLKGKVTSIKVIRMS